MPRENRHVFAEDKVFTGERMLKKMKKNIKKKRGKKYFEMNKEK